MFDITLISTRHEEVGACNANALYQIIESIRPEVLFQEMPSSYLNKHYIERTRTNLETDAVRIYIETNKPIIVAVDIDEIPDETFFREHRRAVERVEKLADENGFIYRHRTDNNWLNASMYGFKYLNSDYCISCNDAVNNAIEKGLEQINEEKLTQAYKAWIEVNQKRENEMLQNIYDYSEENSYDRGVFLLGAGHRKSIIQKIENYKKNSVKLNWLFYGG